MTLRPPISLRRFAALLLLVALTGCSTTPTVLKESKELIDQGRWQDGLARLEQAMKQNPLDAELRILYHYQRERQINRALDAAASETAAGHLDAAADLYRDVLGVDRVNVRAISGLDALNTARRHQIQVADAKAMLDKGDSVSADLMVKGVLTENPANTEARALDRELRDRERRRSLTPPALKTRMQNPVNLEFRDAPLRLAMEAISRSSGINFVFDRDVRPDLKTTIFVKDVRVEDAIDMMLQPNQLERKMLSETTMLIYPSTPQKLRENQELVMRAFHLGNTDPKQTVNLIRTMIKTKDLYVDERVNMLVMRDTPDAIRLAEKLIAMQDLVDPEVMLEIEILEVDRTLVRDLGVTYPTLFTGPGGTLATIKSPTQSQITVNTGYAISLIRNDSDTKTLANPRVRVRNKEKAKVHVGDRVPVISSTLVGSGSAAPVSSEQIQYLDVGIKVDAEAAVYPDETVAVKINLDVSSLGPQTKTAAGTTAYQVGTRNVNTVLRLRDGETQALMGMIRDDDTKTGSGLPFIGELPILDRIFGTSKTDHQRRELVLLITPHIVRGTGRPDATLAEFWSGTEATLRVRSPFSPPLESAAKGTAKPGAPAAAAVPPAGLSPAAPPTGVPAVVLPPAAVPVANAAPASVAVPQPAAVAPATTPPAATPPPAPDQSPPPAADPPPSAAGTLKLNWAAPPKVKAGTEFTLSLGAASAAALKGVTVNLRYQPLEFELISVDDGGYFKRSGAAGVFTPRVEPRLGMISVTLGTGDGSNATGQGNLVTLRLRAVTTAAKAKVDMVSVVGLNDTNQQVGVAGAAGVELAIER